MKKIPLTKGFVALIDDEDEDRLCAYTWCAKVCPYVTYAVSRIGPQIVLMHRFILSLTGKELVDHKNRNGIDNRRSNLRICSMSQNLANQRRRIGTGKTSIYKGVYYQASAKKWNAMIGFNGKQQSLGFFDVEEDAAIAYNRAAIEIYGEFALPNRVLQQR